MLERYYPKFTLVFPGGEIESFEEIDFYDVSIMWMFPES